MKNKTAVITGALSGIGLECLNTFANEGYKIFFSGRNDKRGKELEMKYRSKDLDVKFIAADVSLEDDVFGLMNQVVGTGGVVDVVLNVAGTEGLPSPIDSSTVEDFHKVFNSNVLGTQLMMKHFLPVMRNQRRGSFVCFSSLAGEVGMPGGGIYAASKHAINGLTRTAALEVAEYGVRVNAIAPGPVATDMFDRFVGNDAEAKAAFLKKMPTGRIVTTEEIAGIALFLASDSARSIIGQVIIADGGYAAG